MSENPVAPVPRPTSAKRPQSAPRSRPTSADAGAAPQPAASGDGAARRSAAEDAGVYDDFEDSDEENDVAPRGAQEMDTCSEATDASTPVKSAPGSARKPTESSRRGPAVPPVDTAAAAAAASAGGSARGSARAGKHTASAPASAGRDKSSSSSRSAAAEQRASARNAQSHASAKSSPRGEPPAPATAAAAEQPRRSSPSSSAVASPPTSARSRGNTPEKKATNSTSAPGSARPTQQQQQHGPPSARRQNPSSARSTTAATPPVRTPRSQHATPRGDVPVPSPPPKVREAGSRPGSARSTTAHNSTGATPAPAESQNPLPTSSASANATPKKKKRSAKTESSATDAGASPSQTTPSKPSRKPEARRDESSSPAADGSTKKRKKKAESMDRSKTEEHPDSSAARTSDGGGGSARRAPSSTPGSARADRMHSARVEEATPAEDDTDVACHDEQQRQQQRRNADGEEAVFGARLWRSANGRGGAAPPKAHRWAAAVHGPNVYLMGGIVNSKPSNAIYAFNVQSSTFKSLGSGSGDAKPPPVTGHTFTACGNVVVLVGGGAPTVFTFASKSGCWKAVKAADALSDMSWRADPRDPNDRKGHSAVAFEGSVYVFGGTTKRGKTNLVDLFHVESGKWEPMSTPEADGRDPGAAAAESSSVSAVCHHTAVAFDRRMVVFGGKDAAGDNSAHVHVFDMVARSWTAEMPCGGGAKVPSGRCGHGAVAASATTMAVYGGTTGSCDFSNELWLLNVADFVWTQVDVAGAPPRAFGAFALGAATTKADDDAAAAGSDEDEGDGAAEVGDRRAAAVNEDGADDDSTAAVSKLAFVWLGGGALPAAGGSRYAQLAFTASADVLVLGNTKRRRTIGYAAPEDVADEGDETSPNRGESRTRAADAPTQRNQSGASRRPSSAPARSSSSKAHDSGGGGGGASASGNASTSHRRGSAYWKLGSEFPPPPPIPPKKGASDKKDGDGDEPKKVAGISERTLQRLCPSKEERDRRLEAVRRKHDANAKAAATADGKEPPAKLTADQLKQAADRMCSSEMKSRENHRAALLKKVLGQYQPPESRTLTTEELQQQSLRLCDKDVKRFNDAHARSVRKYGFVPQPRKRSPLSREELNERFYGVAAKRVTRHEALLRKYVKDPKTMALDEDELKAVIERLNKGAKE